MPISVGTRLGRYEIRSLLGAGGMGEVYLAQDTQLDRIVALKILPADVASDQQCMYRFVQEAKAASSLNHQNIITIYEIGQADLAHFIATEFIDGSTLRQQMKQEQMRLGEVLDVAIQIASALSAAHEAGIVHRDIKPENIMLRRRDGFVKVLDFGLVKLTEHPPRTSDTEAPTRVLLNTSPGMVIGTASYMSPEQARGLEVDARSDIWSLGVVLYEMVAGRRPFEGATTMDVLSIILHHEPPSLLLYRSDVPAELERIVDKSLTKEREERYQLAKELSVDLKRLKRRLEIEAEMERSMTPEDQARFGVGSLVRRSQSAISATTQAAAAALTAEASAPHTVSSAEYVVGKIKRHKLGVFVALMVAVIASMAAAGYFAYSGYAGRNSGGAIRSVAVLPFTNTSGNPDTEYLSDGISESLINSLSQLPGLKVIARSSSFRYKNKEVDPQEVARALGVQAVVSGRVGQRGEQLQVSVEMVDAREGTQMWGAQYNRKASDLLQVQWEISREIAEKLRLRLTTGDERQLAKRDTVNPQAYELLLKARFSNRKGGTEYLKKGVEYYQQAIAVDPAYALAYADLSSTYSGLVSAGILDPKEFTPKAEAAARKALELDESLAEAHVALASFKLGAWDWPAAERELKRAIELNPNLSTAHNRYSFYLSLMGQHEEAIAEITRAKELDPISPIVELNVGFRLYFARRYDQAIEALKKALELEQSHNETRLFLGFTYAAKGMYEEAIAEYQESIKLGGDTASTQIYLGATYAKAGEPGKAQAILKRSQTSGEYYSPAELAVLYSALGEREQAFASLENAYTVHDVQLQFLGVDPAYDSLRDDARFADLMRRVGLTP